ncbi:MAG: AI-2E family transporter [Methylocystis sp.]
MFEESTGRDITSSSIAAALIVAGLIYGRVLLIPLSLAAILAFMLAPLVNRLTRLNVPHGVAVGIVLAGCLSLAFIGSGVFSRQVLTLTASLSTYKGNLSQKLHSFAHLRANGGEIQRAVDSIDQLMREFEEQFPGAPKPEEQVRVVVEKNASTNILETLLAGLGPLEAVLLTLLYTAVLLAEQDDIVDRVVRLAGVENLTGSTSALSESGKRLSHYFLMQTLINVGFGIAVGAVLALIGVPHATLWAMATIILRFLPFIGTVIAATPPVLLAAAVEPGWTLTLVTLALFVVGEFVTNHFAQPLVLGRHIGLSTFAIIAAGSFWSFVWGPVGLLLSAPLTIILVVLGEYAPRFRFLSIVFGNKPPLTPDEEFYRRLLAEDAIGASEQLEEANEVKPAQIVADDIVLPALRLDAKDQRAQRLDSNKTLRMKETMIEMDEIVSPKFGEEQSTAAELANAADAYFIAAHGPIDAMATQFAVAWLKRMTGRECAAVNQATGLMALASLKALKETPPTIAVLSVGGLDRSHLRLLLRRAVSAFPESRIIACDWIGASDKDQAAQKKAAPDAVIHCASMAAVTQTLRFGAPPQTGTTLAVAG